MDAENAVFRDVTLTFKARIEVPPKVGYPGLSMKLTTPARLGLDAVEWEISAWAESEEEAREQLNSFRRAFAAALLAGLPAGENP